MAVPINSTLLRRGLEQFSLLITLKDSFKEETEKEKEM